MCCAAGTAGARRSPTWFVRPRNDHKRCESTRRTAEFGHERALRAPTGGRQVGLTRRTRNGCQRRYDVFHSPDFEY